MSKFKVDSEQIETTVETLKKLLGECEEIYDKKVPVSDVDKGQTHEELITVCDNIRTTCYYFGQLIHNTIEFLGKSSEMFKQSDTTSADAITDATTGGGSSGGGGSSWGPTHGGGGTQIDGSSTVTYDYQQEINKITADATAKGEEITWNYADGNGIQAVSCQWYSYAKLCERGFAKDTGAFFSLDSASATISTGDNHTFTGAVSAIEEHLKTNGEPIYNVLIQGDSNGHTVLIDKAYLDKSGSLKLVFSEHADRSKTIPVAANIDGVTQTYPFMPQKEYSESEWKKIWDMSKVVHSIKIYGPSK